MSFTHDDIGFPRVSKTAQISLVQQGQVLGMGTKATDFKGQETPCPLWHILSFSVWHGVVGVMAKIGRVNYMTALFVIASFMLKGIL
jgi:hypothetical protein